MSGKLTVVGFGPGSKGDMTLRAGEAIETADIVTGYTTYIKILKEFFPDKNYKATGMMKEIDRCRMAIEDAMAGNNVAMVSSGDSGIYGMTGLIYELAFDMKADIEIESVPGVTAASSAASVLGAPLIHDFCLISLSDLLTPWEKIETRLLCASQADFVIVLYNPASHKRKDYLQKACELMLRHKSPETVCGLVKNIGREGEEYRILTLAELKDTQVDMFTTVFIGNSQTKELNNKMVTPRGYQGVGGKL